jgi:hypothetical protein
MGTLRPAQHLVKNTVTRIARTFSGNRPEAIKNAVATQPSNVGPSKVGNAVSWPGKKG